MSSRRVSFRPLDRSPPPSPPRKVPRLMPKVDSPALPPPLSLPRNHMLERLSSDVCEQIAAFASASLQTEDSLNFAELGPAHSAAVMRCLDYKFSLPTVFAKSHPARWVRVLQADLMELDLTCAIQPCASSILALFSSKRLCVAAVMNDPVVLQALKGAQPKKLRELRVRICHEDTDQLLFKTLSHLPLTKLELTCSSISYRSCPLTDKKCFNAQRNILAEVCPKVTSLGIDCDCGIHPFELTTPTEYGLEKRSLWRILPGMLNVREIAFRNSFPISVLPKLRRMESVRIPDTSSLTPASRIGKPMKEVSCLAQQTSHMLKKFLHRCTRLRLLAITITPGAEVMLAAAAEADRLNHLKSLYLSWGRQDICVHGMQARHRCQDCFRKPQAAVHRAVTRIVENCSKLENLRLTYVAISQDELIEMLQKVGERLRTFETTLFHQENSPLVRLQTLLCVAARHNRNLRTFDCDLGAFDGRFRRKCDVDEEERVLVRDQAGQVLSALRQLHKRAPHFDQASIAKSMESLLEDISECGAGANSHTVWVCHRLVAKEVL